MSKKPKFKVGQVVALVDDVGDVNGYFRIRQIDDGGVKLANLFYRKSLRSIRALTKRERGAV